jgi:hypothetical protein
MHGWESFDTGRCVRCAIYTETSDLLFGHDGRAYCVSCGAPPAPPPRPRSAVYREHLAWSSPDRSPNDQRVRLVVGAMLVLTLAFPLAACVSQL